MPGPTVGILTPGDMGHALGAVLKKHGLRVLSSLDGRSERTRHLAAKAGIVDVGDCETLVREADIVLSVLAPSAARAIAERVARALRATRADLLFIDCNAIAPQTVRALAAELTAAGARFVDAGIIGAPPRAGEERNRIYVSGRHATEAAPLSAFGLDVRILGPEVGQASGLKMCYAAMTKGITALATELLVAGHALGLDQALRAELEQGRTNLWRWLERQIPGMPPKAYRWVGEMEEIAATFAHLGLTPRILEGAADMYRLVADSPLKDETPEHRRRGTTVDAVIADLTAAL